METLKENLPITAWAEDDRPREKLMSKGRHVLSDAELIAILIASGNTEETAVELSKRILNSVNNNLNELGKLTINDLTKFRGIGEAKAISIIAALELGRRRKETEVIKREKITTSAGVYEIFKSLLLDLPHEEFWVLLLSRSGNIIKKEMISRGGVSGTVVDSKIIFKSAVENLACSVILCHNHPSGNTKPSEQDIQITKKLKEAGRLLEIPVLDHVIVSETGYYSFADEGMM
ncbi:MAG: DNA repair protein RadC [Bacteroidetes bacterium]|nr:DNA repair protein RadC [Bacteroidota bacterium]